MTDEELDAAITEAVLAATAEEKLVRLERLRQSVIAERRLLRGLCIAAIVAAMVAGGVAAWAKVTVDNAEADRAENRITSCVAFNDQQQRSIDANEAQVREVFRSLTSDDELTPEERAELDRLFADHDAVIEASFPLRDCSPDGIDAYFDDDDTTNPYVREGQ